MKDMRDQGQNTGSMKTEKSIAVQIIEFIQAEGLTIGDHLPAQLLADRLRVSRSPINEALCLLHEKGVLSRERNRGYFLAKSVTQPAADLAEQWGLDESDVVTTVYFKIADDRLKGLLSDEFSESLIKNRYGLTAAQLQAVLSRISQEGWANRKPGYGWVFSSMLTTPDSLLQSYRLRLALEPAALLEPGYRLDPQVLARCRAAELHLLEGGIETDTADQLHERGVRFHESLVEASGNPFSSTRYAASTACRLLSYRSMQNRKRYKEHCLQHLGVLELLEKGRNEEASEALRSHLFSTLKNLGEISDLLKS
ncbi:GntR family transcriptional regulator [Polaromonas sp. P1(28)-8]|nr:GntR family transcriptional regulator [Polaromonas sp. P1(28)-8]